MIILSTFIAHALLLPFASFASPTPLVQKLTEFHFQDALEPRLRAALFLVPSPGAEASDEILDAWVQSAGRTTLRFDVNAIVQRFRNMPEYSNPVGYAVRDLAETIALSLEDRPSNLTIGLVVSKNSLADEHHVLLKALYDWITERYLKIGSRLYSLDKTSLFVFLDDVADESELPQAFLNRMTFRARVTDCRAELAGLTKEALQLPGLSFTQGHASRQPKPH